MSMRRSLGALLGACALSVSLVACGGGGGGSATPDLGELRDEFVGTWGLVSMESESTTLSEEDVDELAEKGTLVTLDLDEDGSAVTRLGRFGRTGPKAVRVVYLGDEDVDRGVVVHTVRVRR